MANLYIADDGTIHDRDLENGQSHRSTPTSPHSARPATQQTIYQPTAPVSGFRVFLFWVAALGISWFLGNLFYEMIGAHVFVPYDPVTTKSQASYNDSCLALSIMLPILGLIASSLYNLSGAWDLHYNLPALIYSIATAIATVLISIFLNLLIYWVFDSLHPYVFLSGVVWLLWGITLGGD